MIYTKQAQTANNAAAAKNLKEVAASRSLTATATETESMNTAANTRNTANMRTILRSFLTLAALFVVSCLPLFGQGSYYGSFVWTSSRSAAYGQAQPLMLQPFSKVTVCANPATFAGQVCSNQVAVYADAGMTVQLTQPLQADALGQFGFYIAPGNYNYTVQTGSGAIQTYPFSAGGGGGGGSTPAGPLQSIQYNGGSALGGVGGASVDPTTAYTYSQAHNVEIKKNTANSPGQIRYFTYRSDIQDDASAVHPLIFDVRTNHNALFTNYTTSNAISTGIEIDMNHTGNTDTNPLSKYITDTGAGSSPGDEGTVGDRTFITNPGMFTGTTTSSGTGLITLNVADTTSPSANCGSVGLRGDGVTVPASCAGQRDVMNISHPIASGLLTAHNTGNNTYTTDVAIPSGYITTFLGQITQSVDLGGTTWQPYNSVTVTYSKTSGSASAITTGQRLCFPSNPVEQVLVTAATSSTITANFGRDFQSGSGFAVCNLAGLTLDVPDAITGNMEFFPVWAVLDAHTIATGYSDPTGFKNYLPLYNTILANHPSGVAFHMYPAAEVIDVAASGSLYTTYPNMTWTLSSGNSMTVASGDSLVMPNGANRQMTGRHVQFNGGGHNNNSIEDIFDLNSVGVYAVQQINGNVAPSSYGENGGPFTSPILQEINRPFGTGEKWAYMPANGARTFGCPWVGAGCGLPSTTAVVIDRFQTAGGQEAKWSYFPGDSTHHFQFVNQVDFREGPSAGIGNVDTNSVSARPDPGNGSGGKFLYNVGRGASNPYTQACYPFPYGTPPTAICAGNPNPVTRSNKGFNFAADQDFYAGRVYATGIVQGAGLVSGYHNWRPIAEATYGGTTGSVTYTYCIAPVVNGYEGACDTTPPIGPPRYNSILTNGLTSGNTASIAVGTEFDYGYPAGTTLNLYVVGNATSPTPVIRKIGNYPSGSTTTVTDDGSVGTVVATLPTGTAQTPVTASTLQLQSTDGRSVTTVSAPNAGTVLVNGSPISGGGGGASNVQVTSTAFPALNTAAFQQALANAANQFVGVDLNGDSFNICNQTNCSTGPTRGSEFPEAVRNALLNAGYPSGGSGFHGLIFSAASSPAPIDPDYWTVTGTYDTSSNDFGPYQGSSNTLVHLTSGATATWHDYRAVKDDTLYLACVTKAASGTMTYSVDGGTATAVTACNTATGSATKHWATIPLGTSGDHTVVFTSTGDSYIYGAKGKNGTHGIFVDVHAIGGATAGMFGSAPTTQLGFHDTDPVQPQLVMMQDQTNDVATGVSISTFTTNLTQFASHFTTKQVSLLIPPVDVVSTGSGLNFGPYTAAQLSVCLSLSLQCGNVQDQWGTTYNSASGLWDLSGTAWPSGNAGVHYSNAGAAAAAQVAFAKVLSPSDCTTNCTFQGQVAASNIAITGNTATGNNAVLQLKTSDGGAQLFSVGASADFSDYFNVYDNNYSTRPFQVAPNTPTGALVLSPSGASTPTLKASSYYEGAYLCGGSTCSVPEAAHFVFANTAGGTVTLPVPVINPSYTSTGGDFAGFVHPIVVMNSSSGYVTLAVPSGWAGNASGQVIPPNKSVTCGTFVLGGTTNWYCGQAPDNTSVGTAIASASTIAPTFYLTHITGTTAVANITVPYTGFTGCRKLIPDGAFTTTAAGNIGLATTAVVGKALEECYDGTKWYPSY